MRRIDYGNDRLLLGDDAADALMGFAVRLAREESAVSLPVRALGESGEEITLDILIGPATMMTARHVDVDFDEPDNTALLADIGYRLSLLDRPPFVQGTEAEPQEFNEY